MMLEHKAVPIAGVEVLDEEEGIVSTIVSVTGIVDRVRDVIVPGAYTKTLLERTPKGVWHHDIKAPVSKTLEIKELMPGDKALPAKLPDGSPWPAHAGALLVKTQFNLGGERGRQAFADVKFFGAEQEWSIGYRVPPGRAETKNGIRFCKEVDLYEYSPVLFGAMPAARTIVSVKEAQDTWDEIKGELFGTCSDGNGTCCLSCGDKVTMESKDDHGHSHDDESADRWIVDFGSTLHDELPAIVGTFGTKALADAWADIFVLDSDEERPEVRVFDETKDDEDDEAGFDEFMDAFLLLAEGEDEVKGIFREALHKRAGDGRFAAKLGELAQDASDARSDFQRRRDPKTRFDAGRSSYKRSRDRAFSVEKKVARIQRREPSRSVADLAAMTWASRHLPASERGGFDKSLGLDESKLRTSAVEALANGNPKRAARITKTLGSLSALLTAKEKPSDEIRLTIDPEVLRVYDSVMAPSPGPKKVRVGMGAMPMGAGTKEDDPFSLFAEPMELKSDDDKAEAVEAVDRKSPKQILREDEVDAFEDFYVTLITELLDAAGDFDFVDAEEKTGVWREGRIKRDPFGRFSGAVGTAFEAAKRINDARRGGTEVRMARADQSYERVQPRAHAVEAVLARVQKRVPDAQVADLGATMWAARYLGRDNGERAAWLDKIGFSPDYNVPKTVDSLATPGGRANALLAKALPAVAERYFGVPVRRPGLEPGQYVDTVAMKDDDLDELEVKRYVSGWDEAKHPRDAQGKFTDSPGEAAMKQALSKMQKGAESAGEALERLTMDEGDADEMGMAYFNSKTTPAPVDPNAPRMLQGNPGDEDLNVTDVQHEGTISDAVTANVRGQIIAANVASKLKMDPQAKTDLQLIGGAIEGGRRVNNPDDRIQMATTMTSGRDLADAYDNVMADLTKPRKGSKAASADALAKAVQVDMISTFGQGWKSRMKKVPGPKRTELHEKRRKAEKKAKIVGAVSTAAVVAAYTALGISVLAAGSMKSDPALEGQEPETPAPGAEDAVPAGPVEGDGTEVSETPPEERVSLVDILDDLAIPDSFLDDIHRFDTAGITDRMEIADDEVTMRAAMAAIMHSEIGDDTVDEVVEADEPVEVGDDLVEEAEPTGVPEPVEAKDWSVIDEALDFIDPEHKGLDADDYEFKGDDESDPAAEAAEPVDEAEEIEDALDELLHDLFGEGLDGDPEDGPDEEKFDANLHPRGPDGKFATRGGAGHKLRSVSRALQYQNKIAYSLRSNSRGRRQKLAAKRYSKAQKPAWRRERLLAKVQKRKPSRQLAKLESAMIGSSVLPPDERREYLGNIGVDLNDLRRSVRRDFRTNGASPRIQRRVDRNVANLTDLYFRSEGNSSVKAIIDEFELELKYEASIDELISDWDEEHVFDLMSKMDSEELEALIEAVETKATPVSEATGGMVAQPGKGNKGNIKPIMRWFERGEGAAKIRWGTKGDFMRCVHLAEKHMTPENAKGFCNKRHRAVTGSAPGQGPHVAVPNKLKGKGLDDDGLFDTETKCVLCTGEIIDSTCTVCLGDFSQKGLRHFVEGLISRDGDGKFAPKSSSSGKKTTIERRVAGGVAKTVVKHPKGAAAAVAGGYAIHRRRKNKKAAAGAPGSGGSPVGGADSWVDTVDALADMAGDPNSLLNHMVDKGIAKQQNGDFHVDLKAKLGGAQAQLSGAYDKVRFPAYLGMSQQLAKLYPSPKLPTANAPGAAAPPVPRGLPESIHIDMDADEIHTTTGGTKKTYPAAEAEKLFAELDKAAKTGQRVKVPASTRPAPKKPESDVGAPDTTPMSDAKLEHEIRRVGTLVESRTATPDERNYYAVLVQEAKNRTHKGLPDGLELKDGDEVLSGDELWLMQARLDRIRLGSS